MTWDTVWLQSSNIVEYYVKFTGFQAQLAR
jgi:hypothetical protein